MKPFSEACDQNRQPILDVLRNEFAGINKVLEIGSGTGQHAIFFAQQLPELIWQTSDVCEYHPGIQAWIDDSHATNCLAPLDLDVRSPTWPKQDFDAVFSANTTHIMSWPAVECLFSGVGKLLDQGGCFCLYGPFNKNGAYTSESNARFDQWLLQRDPDSGIRDLSALQKLARQHGLQFMREHTMPANNLMLVWQKNQGCLA